MFEVRFTSAMTDADVELLRRRLDMTTHMQHKLPVDPNSPGVVRLDDDTGLFLERGAGKNQWLLQARAWGAPSAQAIHDWYVRSSQVARRLDPRVSIPKRAPQPESETPQHLVGRASSGRLAAIRRRLVGLP